MTEKVTITYKRTVEESGRVDIDVEAENAKLLQATPANLKSVWGEMVLGMATGEKLKPMEDKVSPWEITVQTSLDPVPPPKQAIGIDYDEIALDTINKVLDALAFTEFKDGYGVSRKARAQIVIANALRNVRTL